MQIGNTYALPEEEPGDAKNTNNEEHNYTRKRGRGREKLGKEIESFRSGNLFHACFNTECFVR